MACVPAGKKGRCVKQCPTGRSGKTGRCFKSERGRKRSLAQIAAKIRANSVLRRGARRLKAMRAARLMAVPVAAPMAAGMQRRSMRKKR